MPTCSHCNNRNFVNEDALRQHVKTSSLHPFCDPCGRRFSNEKGYESHMAAKHPPTFDCLKCNRGYRTQSALEDHYRGSTAHPSCSRCGKGYKNKHALEEHFSVQHAQVSCSCGPGTWYLDELPMHYRQSVDHPNCHVCGNGFKDAEELAVHVSSQHPMQTPDQGQQPSDQNILGKQRALTTFDSPLLSLQTSFGSPLLDVKAPIFSPSSLPLPGQMMSQVWAQRQNSSNQALSGLLLSDEYSPFNRDYDYLLHKSDPVIPRGDNNKIATQPIGTELKAKFRSINSNSGNTHGALDNPLTFTSRPGAKSVQLPSTVSNVLESPSFSSPGSYTSNEVSSAVSSVTTEPLQSPEGRSLWGVRKASDLVSAVATPAFPYLTLSPPSSVEAGLLPANTPSNNSPTSSDSPDVNSPNGLAELPSVSPLVTTPIDLGYVFNGTKDPFEFREARHSLPDSPCVITNVSVATGRSPASDTLQSARLSSVAPISPKVGMSPARGATNMVTSGTTPSTVTSPVNTFFKTPLGSPIEHSNNTQLDDDQLQMKAKFIPVPAIQSSATKTGVVLSNVGNSGYRQPQSNAYNAPSLPLPTSPVPVPDWCSSGREPLLYFKRSPTTAVEPLLPVRRKHSQAPTPSLHCRQCGADPCEIITITNCGHLFCYWCITGYIIRHASCPVCHKALWLYCAHPLDYSA
ncbi:hypothetical protein AMATHDRAFT_47854 [Amanita thiersii Skay4041]|uniref:RING-type domain-containing protein n=1 Tax=Amanita thiersii Skay4041 TaxID=703135 RepID=A0A2A9NQD7_9AGAR|nr:hypothetical protein AMATHDRAFT_47854 [Amanita thiersii Skay4041]